MNYSSLNQSLFSWRIWRTDSLISCKCCVIARSTASPSRFAGQRKYQDAGVTAFLVEKRGRNSYSARDQRSLSGSQWYPTPVDSRQSASGVDGSCHQVQKIIQLLALNGNALLVKILFQLVALAFGNHARRPTRHRALNGLTDKTAVAHLGHGNFVDVAATLRTNLNQTVFRQFNKGFTNRLA